MAKKKTKKQKVTLWDLHEALDRVSLLSEFFEVVGRSNAITNTAEIKEKAKAVQDALGELYVSISSVYCAESDQNERKAFMDAVDFRHHLDGDSNGTSLYPRAKDVVREKGCAKKCGVLEVWVTNVGQVNLKKKISKKKK